MAKDQTLRHEELLSRSFSLSEDIRFVKELQWKILYYPILALAALIALFQLDIPMDEVCHVVLKVIASIVVVG